MNTGIYKTQWGWIGLAANSRGVRAVVLPKPTRSAVESELLSLTKRTPVTLSLSKGDSPNGTREVAVRHLKSARLAILQYLQGGARSFSLSLDLQSHPRFRRKVWDVLQTIPYGQKRSYGWVARRLGQPRSARAVGQACGANPFPLFIPCHRVVAADGSLGGFSGGLSLKKRLLALEAAQLNMGRP
jgi:methylated-DNA-[protein]-cysteine S-methyltransferase